MIARILSAFAALLAVSAAHAHDARPVHVQITQHADGTIDAEWRVPAIGIVPGNPRLELDPSFTQLDEIARANHEDFTVFVARFTGNETLVGRTISIRYPTVNPGLFTLMRVTLADETVHSKLLAPDELVWRVPETPTRAGVLSNYTVLGIRHIVEGVDHLLFVACLVLLAGTFKRTLITVTGFTIAHSITLALATLDIIHLPIPPVEAVIALSVLFCARELALSERDSIMRRYPVAVSSSFGLLHGFGFAAALRETGLPQGEIPTALLSFNLGVELGQIAFVAIIFASMLVLREMASKPTDVTPKLAVLRQPAVYGVGAISAYWTLTRLSAIWTT